MDDRNVTRLADTNRPMALRHSMLDLLDPGTLKQVISTALTDNAPVLEFTDGRVYTVAIRPGHRPMAVPDVLGSWIAGHVGAYLAATVLDAAAYQVIVSPLGHASSTAAERLIRVVA